MGASGRCRGHGPLLQQTAQPQHSAIRAMMAILRLFMTSVIADHRHAELRGRSCHK